MIVTLIAPPWYFPDENEARERISQNLGLGYIAALLRSEGHIVSIIDALIAGTECTYVRNGNQIVVRKGLDNKSIAANIHPDTQVIGIGIPFTNIATLAHELTFEIKKTFPDVPLVLGGVYPSVLPERALTSSADYVVIGEGEIAFQKFVEGFNPEEIVGVISNNSMPQKRRYAAERFENLDDIPFPVRDLLPIGRYMLQSPRGEGNARTISIITSRGCPFDCNFCSVHPVCGFKWRARSPENVLAEIEECVTKYKANHIEFEDDNLTYDSERAKIIFEGMLRMPQPPTWSAHNGVRVDRLDRELLKLMKQSGCRRLNLAIESGTPEMLIRMNKKLNLEKVEEIVRICGQLNIHTSAFLLVGYPGETKDSFESTIEYYRKLMRLGLTKVSPFIVNPYPGTKLFNQCKDAGYLTPGTENRIFFVDEYVGIVTPDFSETDVQQWRIKAIDLNYPASLFVNKLGTLKKILSFLLPTFIKEPLWKLLNVVFRKIR